MASCDDDFTLIGDDNQTPHSHHLHHHHQHQQSFDPHCFATKSPQPHPPPPPHTRGDTAGDHEDGDDEYSDTGFRLQTTAANKFNSFAQEDDPNAFNAEADSDPNKSRVNSRDNRQDFEELSDGGTPLYYKKPKSASDGGGGGGGSATGTSGGAVEYRYEYRPDYRKDREEWSDTAIGVLLDAYTDKHMQINRGNLRGRDWQEVATTVSERCNKQKAGKSVEQCKNKVDNLKKRYKVEKHRMHNSGLTVSHWPWFKRIEQIVVNSPLSKVGSDEDIRSAGGSGSASVNALIQQSKSRYSVPTLSTFTVANNVTKPKLMLNHRWRRVVFKVSGGALAGSASENIDPKVALLIAREVSVACRHGVEVAIVVGGRNFFCGDTWVTTTGLDRSTAYQIGMMATVMNSILLQSALEKEGVQTRVQTAFPVQEVAEPYNKRRAIRHLEKGRVVILGGVGAGTGNPLFTTDTASALRASELSADAVLKGTNVDGIYDSHSGNNTSVAFEHISYRELVSRGVTSMDLMALNFCEENGIPVVVFNLLEPGNISRALCGQQVGTLIDNVGKLKWFSAAEWFNLKPLRVTYIKAEETGLWMSGSIKLRTFGLT